MKHDSLKIIRTCVLMIGLSGIVSTTFMHAAPRGIPNEHSAFFSDHMQKVTCTVQKLGKQLQEFLNKCNNNSVDYHINAFEASLTEVQNELIQPLAPYKNEHETFRLTYELFEDIENMIKELVFTIKTYKSKGHMKLGIELKKVSDKFAYIKIKKAALSQATTNQEVADCVKYIEQLSTGFPSKAADVLDCLKHRLGCIK